MIKSIKGEEFFVCDVCDEITMDSFLLTAIYKRKDDYGHFHIACLEEHIGRALKIEDFGFNEVNLQYLFFYSIWCPECRFRKRKRCVIDRRHCNGYCHFKTESYYELEGIMRLNLIRKRLEQ